MAAAASTLPVVIAEMTAAGYVLQPHKLTFRVRRGSDKVYLIDVIKFRKDGTIISALVMASGATVAEALETARVKIIDR